MIAHWIFHEAEWWQFWYPQSGAPGGLIICAGMFLAAGLWNIFHA